MNSLSHKNNQPAKPVMPHGKAKPFVQAKLTVNEPGDIYEQEADAMADRVMRMSSNEIAKPVTGLIGKSLQRKCAHCEEEEEKRRKPIMRKAEAGNSEMSVSSSFAASLNALKSGGQPLDASTRGFMESRFGYDFGNVKIHNDSLAHKSTTDINALAYTNGNHVVFGAGQYNPSENSGKHLIAHELAHVVQQLGYGPGSPIISRTHASKTFPQSDDSELTVSRDITPGKCELRPSSELQGGSGATSESALLYFDYCSGSSGASGSIRINYGEAIDAAGDALKDLLNNLSSGRDQQQSLQDFEDAMKRISPYAVVKFKAGTESAYVTFDTTGRASVEEGVSVTGAAKAALKVFGVQIFVEGTLSAGTGEPLQGGVMVGVESAGSGYVPADCQICKCGEPDPRYKCIVTKSADGTPTPDPVPDLVPKLIPLYFEYAKTDSRIGWETTYDEMLQDVLEFIEMGYTIEKIEGYTSPEGPLEAKKEGDFENTKLAEDRAKEAWRDLIPLIEGKLKVKYAMRYREFKNALSNPPSTKGAGEILGASDTGEVSDRKLFAHIQKLDREAKAQGRDIFEENKIVSEELPESVRVENQQFVEEFRSGKRSAKTKGLELLYKSMRRAFIYLKPPTKKVDLIVHSPEGNSDCSKEQKKLLNDAIPINKDELFVGKCNKPDMETIQYVK